VLQEQVQLRQTLLGDFLRRKREQCSPADFGFTGKRRRTPGLRREEVATLAGVSVTWYSWLEQGRADGVSLEVLNSLATVLDLTCDEHNYLLRLSGFGSIHPINTDVPQSAQFMLEHMRFPAYIMNYCWDVLFWNAYTTQVFGDFSTLLGSDRNMMSYMFTSSRAKLQTVDWAVYAERMVAQLHADYARYIDDAMLNHLIAHWCQISHSFAHLWQQHPVQERRETIKSIEHPVAGTLTFLQTTLHWIDNPKLRLVTFTPTPDSDTERRLKTLTPSGAG
jgi:transcriptional regulator with XRE-family HTH domain